VDTLNPRSGERSYRVILNCRSPNEGDQSVTQLADAISRICTARRYTEDLLANVEDDDWFRLPAGGVSHIAWQAGHLAVCEYGLAMKRVRGVCPEDEQLLSAEHFQLFGKGSVPSEDASRYPSVAEIRELLTRVHTAALNELESLDAAAANEAVADPPHPMFNTKLGALDWCASHEFLHAGQIGLLRRQLGSNWLR